MWVLLIALLPLGGSLLYGLFASTVTSGGRGGSSRGQILLLAGSLAHDTRGCIAATCRSGHLVGRATGQSLTGGNRIEPLSMASRPTRPCSPPSNRRGTARLDLVHLRQPRHRGAVRRCVRRAHERGVQVRVLIDDVYAAGRPAAPTAPCSAPAFRRRRQPDIDSRAPACRASAESPQVLVIDGETGFTGGLNIFSPYGGPMRRTRPVTICTFVCAGRGGASDAELHR